MLAFEHDHARRFARPSRRTPRRCRAGAFRLGRRPRTRRCGAPTGAAPRPSAPARSARASSPCNSGRGSAGRCSRAARIPAPRFDSSRRHDHRPLHRSSSRRDACAPAALASVPATAREMTARRQPTTAKVAHERVRSPQQRPQGTVYCRRVAARLGRRPARRRGSRDRRAAVRDRRRDDRRRAGRARPRPPTRRPQWARDRAARALATSCAARSS